MKTSLFALFLLVPLMLYAQESLYFASQPTFTPDNRDIYFCYDGDIWKVPVQGGTAARVTAMTGYQTSPKISPDGKWLAFTSDEQGNNNVYITPVKGGTIRQLTFHEASDNVASWSADSKYIYFESNRYNNLTTYKVSVEGGTPERLFAGYFNTVAHLVENPVNGVFYFNESNESYSYPTRKGYKGDNNPDIKSWDPAKKEYKQLTTYRGKDMWPTVDSKGNLYFATDEGNGEYNIARLENGKTKVLTSYTSGVQRPEISHDGKKVIFMKDYVIHIYDIETGQTQTPSIQVFENNRPDIMVSNNTDGKISAFDISPDGKKLAFVSRGKLFVSDTKGLFIQSIPTAEKERVVEVKWAKDNTTLYFTRSREGWFNLFKTSADKPSVEKAIYTPDHMVKGLQISNDRSKIAFVTGNSHLEMLHTGDDRIEKLTDNEFWSFQNYEICFSPDDKYIAYTAMNLFERDIFLYNLQNKQSLNLTNSATVENTPAWSPDGKYLYLTANRYNASFPRGTNANLYRVKLDHTDQPYITEEYKKLFSKDTTKKKTEIDISVNLENIHRRWEQVQRGGNQSSVRTFKNGEKNYLLYASSHEGDMAAYVQEIKDFDQQPAKKVKDISSISTYSYSGKDLYILQRGNIYSIDLNGASSKKIDLKQDFSTNNRNEFEQMYYEVWALLADNFYDPGYHGIDWKGKKEYYARFLPHVQSRRDLRTMINDMLGELNSSHLGFSSFGNEERKGTSMRTMGTGILFDNQSPYTVSDIQKGSPAYIKDQKIKPGDILIAVNGKKVDPQTNREYYFTSSVSEKELPLTFQRGNTQYDVTLHTRPARSLTTLFYTEWEDNCREKVTQKTNGRIAYHHMRDMGSDALNNFLIDMSTDAVHKDGLILDLRYNNGGNVHHEVLEYLTRKPHFTWKFRDKQENTHPNHTPGNKPIVVLINERSLSDAEVTSNGIQSLGIGKLIGTETYRWIIFTSGSMLVDGSFCRLPGWGCYNMKGEDMEFAGVKPDIYIRNTFKDRMEGNDPQLDKAIEEIMKEL